MGLSGESLMLLGEGLLGLIISLCSLGAMLNAIKRLLLHWTLIGVQMKCSKARSKK